MLSLPSSVEDVPYIGDVKAQSLHHLDIYTVKDLLDHFPQRYQDTSAIQKVSDVLQSGEGTVLAEVTSARGNFTRSGKYMFKAKVSDDSGELDILWFNQRFLPKIIKQNKTFYFNVKRPDRPNAKDFYCKDYEEFSPETKHLGRISPIYSQTSGVSTKWLRARLKYLVDNIDMIITDPLRDGLRDTYKIIDLATAYRYIHFPETLDEVEVGRKRLGFDEMLHLAINMEKSRQKRQQKPVFQIDQDQELHQSFVKSLPFDLTDAQDRCIKEVSTDLSRSFPMDRLLNGDVGAGKTVVAAATAIQAYKSGYSILIMAPTTILADQHFQTLTRMYRGLDVDIELATSQSKIHSGGSNRFIVGTHALLHNSKDLPRDIAYVIVDEQHRFGVEQRDLLKSLNTQKEFPHFLNMTATPIPRTLTNVIYGEEDVSILDTLPKKRTPITTKIVPDSKFNRSIDWLAKELRTDTTLQAYLVSPLVNKSEQNDNLRSLEDLKELLAQSDFSGINYAFVHGQLSEEQKLQALNSFGAGDTQLLISTTVIEVGIDVPNASIMIIDHAERFGLAQLHQLRGRIGRGEKSSICFLIDSSHNLIDNPNATERLDFFAQNTSGFEIARYDLQNRGPGDLLGTKQAGIPGFKIADLSDIETLSAAKKAARELMGLS